ncbi:MAG TPA: hypothetical protein VGR72_13155 [Candidatus Acidoferrales bacterium]|nr:hypothetical protein [Candidatus Acidoferrales bacterium]
MRIVYPVLPVAVGLLMLGWAGPSRAQDCDQECARAPHPKTVPAICTKPADSKTRPVTGVEAMPATTTDAVRDEFNASSDKIRIVALLSPMCPGCQSGHAVVGRILRKFSSPELQAILVWEPMRGDDSPEAATEQAGQVRDARIWQGWNGNKNVGDLLGKTLDIHDIAWDVYLIYKPGIKWEGQEPPRPTFWMHQLEGLDPKLLLCVDPTRLSAEVAKLLDHSKEGPHGD